MKEIWKDIPDYEGLYQVSNYGRVKAVSKIDEAGKHRKERLLNQTKRLKYWRVKLVKNGQQRNHTTSRILWEAFNGKIPDGYEVNHIDENPDNNCLWNLNLMTPKENTNWASGNERRSRAKINGKCAKRVLQYDLDGNFIKEWPSVSEIGRQLGYGVGNISECCLGKHKFVYGFIWRYAY